MAAAVATVDPVTPFAASAAPPATRQDALLRLPGSDELPRKLWTRDEYHRLLDLGFISEGAPYELLEGEIVAKVTQNRPHVIATTQVFETLIRVFGSGRVQSQSPVALSERSEPEPDAAVLRGRVRDYVAVMPGPADVLLVVEIADATARADLGVKAALYGRAGVAECWVLVPRERTLAVFREPGPNGYANVTTLTEADTVSPLAAPEAIIAVADLLPPAAP